jgi:hypothetical protein
VKTCRAKNCGRAIPSSQNFCRNCLDKLAPDLRHSVLWAPESEKAEAVEIADKYLAGRSDSIRPGTARERFKAARMHAAEAMKTLERKPR